ncbi:MAG: Mth938-like domain-containing protein [Chloroflexia bacterium]
MHVERCDFGVIVVEGKTYRSDLILFPDRVREGWWRQEGHTLHPEDLEEVWAYRPQVLVVGTGQMGRMRVTPETETRCAAEGIQLLAMRTPGACQTFNQLVKTGTRAVAALHLTC